MIRFPFFRQQLVAVRWYDASMHWLQMTTRRGAISEIRSGVMPIEDSNGAAAIEMLRSEIDLRTAGVVCLLSPAYSRQWILEGPGFDSSRVFDSWIDHHMQERWPAGIPDHAATRQVHVLYTDHSTTHAEIAIVSTEALAHLTSACNEGNVNLLSITLESAALVYAPLHAPLFPDIPDACLRIVAPEETRILAFDAARPVALSAQNDVHAGMAGRADSDGPTVAFGFSQGDEADDRFLLADRFREAFCVRPRVVIPPATHFALLCHATAAALGRTEAHGLLASSAIDTARVKIERAHALHTLRRWSMVLSVALLVIAGAHRMAGWKLEQAIPELHRSRAEHLAREHERTTVLAIQDSIRVIRAQRAIQTRAADVLYWLSAEIPPLLVLRGLQLQRQTPDTFGLRLLGTCPSSIEMADLVKRIERAPFYQRGTLAYRIAADDATSKTFSFELRVDVLDPSL